MPKTTINHAAYELRSVKYRIAKPNSASPTCSIGATAQTQSYPFCGKNSPKLADNVGSSDKPYHAKRMSWLAGTVQRLKRVFNIDINQCERCEKTNVKIIACITEPAAIYKVLAPKSNQQPPDTKDSREP